MVPNQTPFQSFFIKVLALAGLMIGGQQSVFAQEKIEVFRLQVQSENPIKEFPFLISESDTPSGSGVWKKLSTEEYTLQSDEAWFVYYITLSEPDQGELYLFAGSGADMEFFVPIDGDVKEFNMLKAGPLTAAAEVSVQFGNSWDQKIVFRAPARSFPVYVRAHHVYHNPITLNPDIQTYVSKLEEREGYNLFLGIFYGVMLFLIVYHTVFFLLHGDKTYAIHVVFMMTIVGFIGYHEGTTYHYLYPNSPYLNYLHNFLLGGIPVAYSLFFRSYLKLYKLSTRRDRWFRKSLKVNIILQLIPVILFLVTRETAWVYTLIHIINLCFILIYTYIFAGAFSRSDRNHLIILSGLASMAGTGIGATLVQLAGYPIDWKTVLEVGVLLESIIFAVGLGYRTRRWEEEKLESNALLIEQLQKNEQLQNQFNQKLQSKVLERSQQLTEALRQAQQAAEVKSEFLISMSHEMRTPLNGIIGMANLLKEESEPAERVQQLDELCISAQDLLHLTNNVLDYSALEEKESSIIEEFSLTHSLASLQALLEKRAHRKGLSFSVHQPEDSLIVQADQRRIERVISNLTSNAIKYTDSGSIEIIVEVIEQNGEDLRLSFRITDTGQGMTPELIAELFQPFRYSNEGFRRANRGSGIGLTLVSKILHGMGSKLDIASQVNVGTTCSFELTLPGKITKVIPSVISSLPDSMSLEGKNILLVEDHIVNQKVGLKYLSKWGIAADLAENGEVAVAMVQAKAYDMILMDLHMPVMDGITAAQQIRALGSSYAEIPIIALSAATHLKEVQHQVIEAGMLGFVTKPFTPKDLRSKMEAYLFSSPAKL